MIVLESLDARIVPTITNKSTQEKVMRIWADVVIEKYSKDVNLAIHHVNKKHSKVVITHCTQNKE